ncbi:MAG: VPLPA-CTERM sorting domain-containing protein [Gammaproteobacteria bacterium]|nr:VPLPA-CTERM sorting domain-containing protein [Gammaproteobacteria bacterium]
MLSPSRRAQCAAVLLCSATGVAQASGVANLVINGSMNFVPGRAGPVGWELLRPTGESFNTFTPSNLSGDGGTYFGIQDLDSSASRINAIGLKQTISGLTVGGRYTLRFESNEDHTNPNFLAQWRVTFGDETRLSTLTNTTWVTDIMHFTASSAVQTLQFVATFLPGAFPQILNIDGVQLTADAAPVPLPTSAWLLAPALVGLARVARKRRG